MRTAHSVVGLMLLGLRIDYAGDSANPDGRGAVVKVVEADDWGGPYASIALADGRMLLRMDARYFGRAGEHEGTGYRILARPGEYADEAELAALQAGVAMRKAADAARKEAAAQARAAARDRLKAEHPFLAVCGENDRGGVFAAKNIRKLLKRTFPGVKFAVTSSYSTVNVRWTDGPEGAAVRATVDCFKEGSFDGMTDCYEYATTAWNDVFGGCRYVFCNRNGYLT